MKEKKIISEYKPQVSTKRRWVISTNNNKYYLNIDKHCINMEDGYVSWFVNAAKTRLNRFSDPEEIKKLYFIFELKGCL